MWLLIPVNFLRKYHCPLNIRRMVLLIFICATALPVFSQGEETAKSSFWLWTFLGRLHPMVVHFPIGLLVVALIMEMIGRKKKNYHDAIKTVVVIGTISSVLAVVMGLMLAQAEDYGGIIKDIHQWTGIATMVLAGITTYAYMRMSRQLQVFLLTITVVGVTVAGHYGASLTHGEDYLTSVLPSSDAAGSNFVLATTDGPLSETQVQELNLQVRTILAHSCNNCHGVAKTKGDLRLDSREYIEKGGESGPVIVPGDPGKSELMRRVLLPSNHKEYMPAKGKGLTKEEIAILDYWIRKGAPWPEGELKSLFRVAELAPRMPEIPAANGDIIQPLDRFVDAYFKEHTIEWQKPVDDHIYVRRVYLDVIGLLPTPEAVYDFVNDPAPDKRNRLAAQLLERNSDYAQHWLTFWNDALRNDYTGTGYITGGRSDITKWLYNSILDNKPYNRFVSELINPVDESKGFIRGIKWRGTINSSQSTEMQAAQNVSQVFLGLNLKCASCHDSFISDWTLEDAYAFANIFSDSTLEINRCDKPTGQMADRRMLYYRQLGNIDSVAPTGDRLKQLAQYLVQDNNGRLYRTLVNRIWAQLMGRGIVEPVDVMDNAPWSQDLLDWLASDFTANGYDIKRLIYTILTSKTYQLPSTSVEQAEHLVAQDFVFRGMMRRRLTAEQFADAVSRSIEPIYGDSMVVHKLFPGTVKGTLPFARAALVKNDPFLTALGRPNRENVSTGRMSQANLLQALELTNGEQFNEAVKRGAAGWIKKYPETEKLVTEIYKSALGRAPVEKEIAIAKKEMGERPDQAAVEDFIWAVTLHPEFQLIF
ncbi:MAG: DUF1549 domain-containing protein [Chitinophagaceae bacterium]|nr:DUF1549 domain-containing protein [Chitinophagaceae bacterium]MCW5929393.1 DUF1549 domain-containing protein [Chitinophagaceae bacterium]